MQKRYRWLVSIVLTLLFLASSTGYALAAPDDMVRVIIGFDSVMRSTGETSIKSRGGIVRQQFHFIPAVTAEVPQSIIPVLRSLQGIAYVEPDIEVQALEQTVPWGIQDIGAVEVQAYSRGQGVKVGIIDTGISLAHSDLNVAGEVTFVSGTSSGNDDNGHGTHVAGIIAALDNDTGVIGAAPEARLYAIKVLNSRGSGVISGVISGIQWAVDNDMDVINMSLGSSTGSTAWKQACDKAWEAGVLVVAAAGNSGQANTNLDNVNYPAKYDSVIAVGAVDSNHQRASFSSTGPQVEIAAPGVNINSTYKGNSYKTMNGTSMAAPHVAGVAALIISSGVQDTNRNGRINDEVRERLRQAARDLGPGGRDREYGFGLIDATLAVSQPVNDPPAADAGNDQSVFVNTTVYLDGSGSSDPEGADLSYSWTQTGGPTVTLDDSSSVRPCFTPAETGIYQFQLIVNDGELSSLPDTVSITVRAENNPPTAPVVSISPADPLTADNLVCSILTPSEDADDDEISYSYAWYKDGVLQAGLVSGSVSHTATRKGEEWRCEVTPSDGMENGPSGSAAVTIGNTPPTANAGPDQNVSLNTLVTLNGSLSADADGDSLSYQWEQTDGPEVVLSDADTVISTFMPQSEGICTFRLTVSDGTASSSDTVTVSISTEPATNMHVESIQMTLIQRYSGYRTYATAGVFVKGADGGPIAGAVVKGRWTGIVNRSVTGITGSTGQIVFVSPETRCPAPGAVFTFVVESLSKSDFTYDPAFNRTGSESVTVP